MTSASAPIGFLALDDGGGLRLVELRPGVTSIGRGVAADVRVDCAGASQRHAALVVDPGGTVEIVDDRSDTGTYVNGASVDRRVLQPGDTIRIGRCVLGYVAAPAERPLAAA
ncbi:MAG TPA: FHA domain-containing protein [Solirubrobacteraceae bacterium]|nr:FHA domain-containing protein [Solirubrobacteraceae bacterium]